MSGIEILEFNLELKARLPDTYRLLKAAKLRVHPRVKKITLHGSRGLSGKPRVDSDLDLCLVTDIDVRILPEAQSGLLLRKVLLTTLETARCKVELDLAAAFDHMGCGLHCLNAAEFEKIKCRTRQDGCMGIYKIQKGFNGFIPPITKVEKMFPFMAIWQREY